MWQQETDKLTCCQSGTPQAEGAVRNLSFVELETRPEAEADAALDCRDFQLSFLARRARLLSDQEEELDEPSLRLRCKCPPASGKGHVSGGRSSGT